MITKRKNNFTEPETNMSRIQKVINGETTKLFLENPTFEELEQALDLTSITELKIK